MVILVAPHCHTVPWYTEMTLMLTAQPNPRVLGSTVTGGGRDRYIAHVGPTSLGLAPERDKSGHGPSIRVIQTIQAARTGPITAHNTKWLGFQCWCEKRRLDLLACGVGFILSFLQYLLEKGLSHAIIKACTAAVFSCHEVLSNNRSTLVHPFMKCFLPGVRKGSASWTTFCLLI